MTDFWNFHDTLSLAAHNWSWLLVALALGVIVGWKTCERSDSSKP